MTSKNYTNKIDIFALGLILFELTVPFDTQMERIKLMTEARYGQYPESFLNDFPREVSLSAFLSITYIFLMITSAECFSVLHWQ